MTDPGNYSFNYTRYFDDGDTIDSNDHLSEIEYYPLSDAEIGEMVYYQALGDDLEKQAGQD